MVPTRAAAAQLAETRTRGDQKHAGIRSPKAGDMRTLFLTRDELYDELYARLVDPPARLTPPERDAIAQAAALDAGATEPSLPFQIRPGLVAEMVRFYDQLRRQSQQVSRFEELIVGALGDDRSDRGVERLLAQTRFLASAFRSYETRIIARGACDEHVLRDRLILDEAPRPLRHVIVSIADWIADPAGLFPADFDLLSRLPRLESIDVVCTEAVLRSGFHERIHRWLPGIEEIAARPGLPFGGPALLCPPEESGALWFTHRDQEEELIGVARRLLGSESGGSGAFREDVDTARLDRTAIVFKHPLPYLYLSPDTLGARGLAYQAFDALPLAAQPAVAAVDLILDAAEARFSRSSLVALLRSPHLRFDGAEAVTPSAIGALDRTLSRLRYLGDAARFETLARKWPEDSASRSAVPALHTAAAAVRAIAPLLEAAPASEHIDRMSLLLEQHFSRLDSSVPTAPREHGARTAITTLLQRLSQAHKDHYNPLWTIDDTASTLRRWLSEETLQVEAGTRGLRLVDDQAARYGDYDDVTIVGLIEKDWPDEPRRNVFYSSALLKTLGWPSEADRRASADARFADLLGSASRTVALSTFTLDDDSPVTRSLQLDDVARLGFSVSHQETAKPVATGDRPSSDGAPAEPETEALQPWAELRASRSAADSPCFHGETGAQSNRPWSVSALETYIACPFKFFAQHVLRLEEEPEDEEVMDPRRRGRLVHEVFEAFFRAWQDAGNGQISAGNLEAARQLLPDVVERLLADLPDAEAGLERARLLGSPAAAGLGEAVFRMEAERPVPVVERLLEHSLNGRFVVSTTSGPREVELRGKADRLDLLADGTFRVIDYKLGWPPDRTRALQLPVYGLCAEQQLASRRPGGWSLGEAVYIAFGGPRRVVPLFTTAADRDAVLTAAQQRLVDTLDAIGRGTFPPAPDDVFRCETCSFSSVCRKDYVGDV